MRQESVVSPDFFSNTIIEQNCKLSVDESKSKSEIVLFNWKNSTDAFSSLGETTIKPMSSLAFSVLPMGTCVWDTCSFLFTTKNIIHALL